MPYETYGSSKAALNAVMVHKAGQLREEGVRVVAICPGYNGTNLNHGQGTGDPREGCRIIVDAALQEEGETALVCPPRLPGLGPRLTVE